MSAGGRGGGEHGGSGTHGGPGNASGPADHGGGFNPLGYQGYLRTNNAFMQPPGQVRPIFGPQPGMQQQPPMMPPQMPQQAVHPMFQNYQVPGGQPYGVNIFGPRPGMGMPQPGMPQQMGFR